MNNKELNEKLNILMKEAMLAKDQRKLNAVRMIKAALTTAEKVDPAKDVDVIKLLQSEAKKRQQAAEAFKTGGAADREEQELYEKTLIESFLPKKQTEEETTEHLKNIASVNAFAGQKDMGKLIKEFQSKFPGQQDGGTVSKIAKQLLS